MSDNQSNVAPNTENVESTGILESVQHLATNVMDTAYEKIEAVKEGVISTIHTAEDAAIHMKDQVASTIILAEEKVLSAVHLTGEKAAETKDSAVSTAQTASNIASEKLTQAKQMTGEQMEALGAKATEIKKNTTASAQSATNLASEKLTQASNVASDKLTQAKQMTGEQMEKLGVKASLAKGNAKDTVETAKNSDLLHTVTDTATAVSNSVVEEIQMLKNMATEKIHQVTEAGVYQTGLNLANQAVSTVTSGIETAKSTLSGFTHQASEVKEDIKEKVSEKMDQELKVMPTTEANVVETDNVPTIVNETGTLPTIVKEAADAGFTTPYQALDLNQDTVPNKAPLAEIKPVSTPVNVVDADVASSFVEPSTEEEWTEVKNYHTIQKEKSMVKDQPIADNFQSQAISQERK